MLQLISHLFGDFVFQNDWMAEHKGKHTSKGWLSCFLHCLVYSVFFYGQANIFELSLIFGSHFIIDKFRLAFHWCEAYKVGARFDFSNWIKVYLIFMVDMALHLACNFIILRYI